MGGVKKNGRLRLDLERNWDGRIRKLGKKTKQSVKRSGVGLFAAKVALRVEIEWWMSLAGNLRKGKRAEHSFGNLKR